jgi:hypothetical protein
MESETTYFIVFKSSENVWPEGIPMDSDGFQWHPMASIHPFV